MKWCRVNIATLAGKSKAQRAYQKFPGLFLGELNLENSKIVKYIALPYNNFSLYH